jgi:hypothetical protein
MNGQNIGQAPALFGASGQFWRDPDPTAGIAGPRSDRKLVTFP